MKFTTFTMLSGDQVSINIYMIKYIQELSKNPNATIFFDKDCSVTVQQSLLQVQDAIEKKWNGKI